MFYAHDGLLEQERIAALKRRIDHVHEAQLTALAFNDPPKLADERDAALEAAREHPATATIARREARQRQARLIAALDSGKVLED